MFVFLRDRDTARVIGRLSSELTAGGPRAEAIFKLISDRPGLYPMLGAMSQLYTAMRGFMRARAAGAAPCGRCGCADDGATDPASARAEHVNNLPKERQEKPNAPCRDARLEPFNKILDEIREVHARKSCDYGTVSDPYQNIRSGQEFGVPAWLGAVLRGNDKIQRLKAFAINGNLENESVEDSLLDLATYAAIGLLLYRESQQKSDCTNRKSGSGK